MNKPVQGKYRIDRIHPEAIWMMRCDPMAHPGQCVQEWAPEAEAYCWDRIGGSLDGLTEGGRRLLPMPLVKMQIWGAFVLILGVPFVAGLYWINVVLPRWLNAIGL